MTSAIEEDIVNLQNQILRRYSKEIQTNKKDITAIVLISEKLTLSSQEQEIKIILSDLVTGEQFNRFAEGNSSPEVNRWGKSLEQFEKNGWSVDFDLKEGHFCAHLKVDLHCCNIQTLKLLQKKKCIKDISNTKEHEILKEYKDIIENIQTGSKDYTLRKITIDLKRIEKFVIKGDNPITVPFKSGYSHYLDEKRKTLYFRQNQDTEEPTTSIDLYKSKYVFCYAKILIKRYEKQREENNQIDQEIDYKEINEEFIVKYHSYPTNKIRYLWETLKKKLKDKNIREDYMGHIYKHGTNTTLPKYQMYIKFPNEPSEISIQLKKRNSDKS